MADHGGTFIFKALSLHTPPPPPACVLAPLLEVLTVQLWFIPRSNTKL